ncbi:protein prenylyltransferase [Amniculicola lignicola CBS 123094]|uniref:Geranylgeranyl transferase type-2 subunit alpha n=1 Tax=Amniculicola lignicola CBS 123094 TaxID=1392246 RepID=A0A6A5WDE5_9PLEO|nr:protein prenylyltransferase [Amniculicola lignicola CBS 123094]
MASHGVSRAAGTIVRSEESRKRELQQIAAYQELVDLVNTKERQYTIEVLGLTTKLLNENPEYYTVWNHRRRVLLALSNPPMEDQDQTERLTHNIEELVNDELHLTFGLLRKFPKCYWIWNHRSWVLQQAEKLLSAATAKKIWSGELLLVGKMLQADSRNFHAWSYRRSVVLELERMSTPTSDSAASDPPLPQSLVESEFEYTTKMIKTNLSNFSAWHNRGKLIPPLLAERQADNAARRRMLDDELALICTAINTDPFDQSIWYYHRFLLSTLIPSCPDQSKIAVDLSNSDRAQYYTHEMEYIGEILEDETDCKWIYEALLYLAECSLEVDAGTGAFTTQDMRSWLVQLRRLDPLRMGRWSDLGRALNI